MMMRMMTEKNQSVTDKSPRGVRAARTADEQAPPLLPVARPRLDDGSVDLRVGFRRVLRHFLAFLLDLRDGGLLLDDRGLHLLK